MKISFATLVLCVILCQAEAGSRRNAPMVQPQNGLMSDGTDLSRMNPNPNLDQNMVRYQSNIITGRLSIHVEEMMSYILEKLQALRDVFDRLGWTTLAEYTNKIIEVLDRLENKAQPPPPPTNELPYGGRFLRKQLTPRPCEPLDTRPQCAIVGYGR